MMVTHEPDHRPYVDRVIWLKDGAIELQAEMD
jgi:ABC-type lipoprotein export system ATPase subunit